MKNLEDKIAIVTGAARGIGQASAIELADAGCHVALCDVLECTETLAAIEARGRKSRGFVASVADRPAMERMFAGIVEQFGSIDVLVNNAAINIRKPLVDLEVSDVEKVWAVSQWGVFHCSQLAARQMIRQQTGGAIVMISSVHAEQGYKRSTSYNAAKAAVNQMAKTWAAELAPHRIRVNSIEPGWTDTPGERNFFTEEQIREAGRKLPLGRLAEPIEIARAVRFLASDDASYITGSILRVDGGFVLPS
jgi:glucose 1-dehydrogenase